MHLKLQTLKQRDFRYLVILSGTHAAVYSACEALMPVHVMHRCGEALRVNRVELLPGTLPINIYHIIDIDPIYSKTASSNSKTHVAPAERKVIIQEEN